MTGHELKQIRLKTLHVTQERLAEVLGISTGTVARWEAGGANSGRWPVPHWAVREMHRMTELAKQEAQP